MEEVKRKNKGKIWKEKYEKNYMVGFKKNVG